MKLKLAIRGFLKNPFVTTVAVVSLALGIGANAAIFSIFHQILIRDLPVPQPGRLVNLSSPGPKQGGTSCSDIGDCDSVFSYPMFRDLERQNVFSGIAAHVAFNANLAHGGQTEGGRGLVVSGSYFPVLGVQPAMGRLLGLNGHDPIVLGVSIAVLVLIAFGAGFVPANRASSVDPIRALRYE